MTIIDFQLSDTNRMPKYKQIAERLAEQIESGHLMANDKLPTHRLLADKLGVTVGTVTRAYSEAERKGLVEARVGAGTYVVDKKRHTGHLIKGITMTQTNAISASISPLCLTAAIC